jgi:glucose-6-phosphate-specific signal transduction histidine kinase
MNLVALLIVAQVVGYSDDTAVRVLVAGVAVIGIIVAITISKRRGSGDFAASAPAEAVGSQSG